jgi:protein-tyrosine kinase
MERIKEAVERARAERERGGAIDIQRFRMPEARRPAKTLEDIVYTETRVQRLDRDHLEANRIVSANKIDSRAVPFDMLRTKILNTMTANGWRTLGITSPGPGCGKTTITLNLAISIARQQDYSAVVVDFDLRKPKVRSYLGLPPENSLYDCILGRCTVGEAMVNPGIPRLVVLGNTRPVARASELISSQHVKDLVVDLRERYDRRIVIFDLPPVLSADDTIAFLPQIDCVLLVIASGVSTRADVEECQHVLSPGNLIGVTLNKADDYHIASY